MRIDTKYDVGQTVWLIEKCYSQSEDGTECVWGVAGHMTFDNIIYGEGFILYGNMGEECWDTEDEADLFPTKEEAQAECDRRNGEGK